jgi:ParB family chromosome partitioning protein
MAASSLAVHDLQIDAEFQALIPPLSAEERQQLEANLLRDGCRDALVAWNGVLLDGHNRYEICRRHGLEFGVTQIDLADRDAAANWIDTNQLGRRNLSPLAASEIRGRLYNRLKRSPAQAGAMKGSVRQNDGSSETAERLATQHGVSSRTIERDGQFADAVEELKPFVPDIQERVMRGDVPSKAAVVEAAREPERAEEILSKPHVAHNSGNNEWYTPADYIKAAREALGRIDLDPASSEEANRVVKASRIFTADDDGLSQAWSGRVWLNPPYAQPLVSQFCEKVAQHAEAGDIDAAIVLVNNATETQWFRRLVSVAAMICHPTGRVKFWSPTKESAAPLQGQAIVYVGQNPRAFTEAFASFGYIVSVVRR